jgi:hypothetical protein
LRDAWGTGRQLQLAGLRARFPEESEEQLELRLAERWLGPELFGRVLNRGGRVDWAEDSLSAAEEMAAVFESLGVRYLLGGSMAAAVWSEPRFTRDVDRIAPEDTFNVIRFTRIVKVDAFVAPEAAITPQSGIGRARCGFRATRVARWLRPPRRTC